MAAAEALRWARPAQQIQQIQRYTVLLLPDPAARSSAFVRGAIDAARALAIGRGGDEVVDLVLLAHKAPTDPELPGAIARGCGVAVASGLLPDGGGGGGPSFMLHDANGDLALRYTKPDGDETPEGGLRPGTVAPPPVAELRTSSGQCIRIGAMLGCDVAFPEVARVLMLRGTELLLHLPGCDPAAGVDPRVLRDRAASNDVAAAAVWDGGSLAFDHTGSCDGAVQRLPGGGSLLSWDLAGARQHRLAGSFAGDSRRAPLRYLALGIPAARAAARRLAAAQLASLEPAKLGCRCVVKVALLQLVPLETPAATDPTAAYTAKAELYCRKAAADGADIAVLPESFSVGYGGADQAAAFAQGDSATAVLEGFLAWAQPRSGPFVTALRRVAREEGIAIVATFLEGTPPMEAAVAGTAVEPPRNSLVVIDRLGEIILHYSKVHLAMGRWRAEHGAPLSPEALMSPGSLFGTGVLALSDGRGSVCVGAIICYDLSFPVNSSSAFLCLSVCAQDGLFPRLLTRRVHCIRRPRGSRL